VGAPKTDAGRRTVAIPEVLIPGLRWHLACFVAEGDEGLLFTSTGGMPSRRSDFRNRAWLGAIKRARLGELRFRDLRHQLAGASTADRMIRLTLSRQRTADSASAIIPEPEWPAGGSGFTGSRRCPLRKVSHLRCGSCSASARIYVSPWLRGASPSPGHGDADPVRTKAAGRDLGALRHPGFRDREHGGAGCFRGTPGGGGIGDRVGNATQQAAHRRCRDPV
jgi:hypothetical protein